MEKQKQKKLETTGWKVGGVDDFLGRKPKMNLKPVKMEISRKDMETISSWFMGYELSHAQLIEFECRRILKKKWGHERIMKAFNDGEIGSSDFRKLIKAAKAHYSKGLKLRNRLWADFTKKQPKRRKKKR